MRENGFLQVPGLRHGKIQMMFQGVVCEGRLLWRAGILSFGEVGDWQEEDEGRQGQRDWDQLRREPSESLESQREGQ